MLFGKKKKPAGMNMKQLKELDKRPLKYVTERDGETMRELRLGTEGALNIIDDCLSVVCTGVTVFRCRLDNVSAAELMNLSGITLKGYDEDRKCDRSVIAYYSDGYVSAARAAQRSR